MERIFTLKLIKKFASLEFAITLLFLIGFVIAIGTIIEQDQKLIFYKENYAETQPMFGFLTWKVITFLNLDHIYTSWWFVTLLGLFVISLTSCSFTTQLPSIKTFKLWKFYNNPQSFTNLGIQAQKPLGVFNTTAYYCNSKKYHFFRQQHKGYAYSGLLGRVAPVVVHASIVFLIMGSVIGAFGGFTSQEIVPRGEIAHIQNLTKFGGLSAIPQEESFRINDFWITYTKALKTDQFYSDISILTKDGKELTRKTIFVNEPLIFNDTVYYQTDWDIVGLKIRLQNNKIVQLPLKKIFKSGRKFWLGSLILDKNSGEKISLLVNDLNANIFVYNKQGILLNEVPIGSVINLDKGTSFQFTEFITSTGLQIKSDPGIQTVYFSFLLLMLSIYVSFFTYSQIWLLETPKKLRVGGKSNRSVLFFQQEFRTLLKRSSKVLN